MRGVYLNEIYAAIPDTVTKVMARRVSTDHGDMLTHADGYMTAWFMYWLKGDMQSGKVFFGDDAEICTNANWQDVVSLFFLLVVSHCKNLIQIC